MHDGKQHKTHEYTWNHLWEVVSYIWQIWDLDMTFKELHLSGSVEELREAAEENSADVGGTHKRYKSVFLSSMSNNLPCKKIPKPLSMSQKNIWSNAYKPEHMMGSRLDLTRQCSSHICRNHICTGLTAVKFEQQEDREVVEEAAVQYEGDQRRQSALSGWSCRFGTVGVQLTQN